MKKVVKTVYFRDARGRLRTKEKISYRRIPRKVRTLQLVLAKPKGTQSADRSRFLKPNSLELRRGASFQAPRALEITSVVERVTPPNVVLSEVRHVTARGPGFFFHPSISIPDDGLYILGSALHFPPGSVTPVPTLDDQALSKLLDKVSSSLPDYFLSLAESPKTYDLLKVVIIEALKMAKMIYRLKIREIAGSFIKKGSSIKSLSDYWLAWWYGIMPTVFDIQDTVAFLSEKERFWRSYSARAVLSEKTEVSPLLGVSNISGKQTDTTTYISKYGVIVEGRLGFNDYLLKASKPLSSAALVYELIPLSFVLDWIINIGSYLSGLEVLEDKVYHAWHTASKENTSYSVGRFIPNAVYPGRKHASAPFVAGFTSLSLKRTPLAELPTLKFPRVTKPVFNQAWVKKSVTALALETQALNRLFSH
jgi:hypothetical protein